MKRGEECQREPSDDKVGVQVEFVVEVINHSLWSYESLGRCKKIGEGLTSILGFKGKVLTLPKSQTSECDR